jgi:Xaa-Pro dipeptidase
MPAMLNPFNTPRARRYMKQNNIDALIATSSVNVMYFSGYSCWLDPLFREYMMNPGASSELSQRSFAIFPREGEPTLIVKSNMSPDATDLETKDVRVYGNAGLDYSLLSNPSGTTEARFLSLVRNTPSSTTAVQALTDALRERGLTEGTVGIELEGLSRRLKEELSKALPRTRLLDCTNLIRLIRAVKTTNEIRLLTQAAEISENAAMESLADAHIGTQTRDLVQRFQSSVGKQGANYDHFSLSLGGLGICSEPNYPFRAQDVMFMDYGCVFSSYFSDTGTTLAFAELPRELARRRYALQSCVEVGAKAMRPGVKASSIHHAMIAVLAEAGITNSFPHGHGMGLEVRDYPILVPQNGLEIRDDCIAVDSDMPLEEGMVINLEAPLFMATAGALQVEKTFVVTADGCRELTCQDRTRPYIAT